MNYVIDPYLYEQGDIFHINHGAISKKARKTEER